MLVSCLCFPLSFLLVYQFCCYFQKTAWFRTFPSAFPCGIFHMLHKFLFFVGDFPRVSSGLLWQWFYRIVYTLLNSCQNVNAYCNIRFCVTPLDTVAHKLYLPATASRVQGLKACACTASWGHEFLTLVEGVSYTKGRCQLLWTAVFHTATCLPHSQNQHDNRQERDLSHFLPS